MVAASLRPRDLPSKREVTFGTARVRMGLLSPVRSEDGNAEVTTIAATIAGNMPLRLCDLLHELRVEPDESAGRLRRRRSQYLFAPYRGWDYQAQTSARLAQAEVGNYADSTLSLRKYGLPVEDISRLYIAGWLCHYLDVSRASNRVHRHFLRNGARAGHAALEGAR